MSADLATVDAWQQFVIEHGWRASVTDLSAVVNQPESAIDELRRTGACRRLDTAYRFADLFSIWNGRAPRDDEWPAPRRLRTYEWQAPELALLASLVGQMGVEEIAAVLTARLRERTGDASAERTRNAVQVRTNKIGMVSSDVLGGITTREAATEIGSLAIINQAITKKQLKARRVGKLWVIPHDAWAEWKARRVSPPAGYVLLSQYKAPLSISSDKLSEWCRAGFIPGAMRCNPYGSKGPSTQFGTWYVDKKVGDQLVADRRAGKPMPWHGKPMMDNLTVTYKLWQSRQHPKECATCATIWGKAGAPGSFESYVERYPPLAHGAKRHLTRPWSPGLTISEVATKSNRSENYVRRAIRNGVLAAQQTKGRWHVTRTDATRWVARKCPTGDSEKSWVSLQTACKQYLFTMAELRKHIVAGDLRSKVGTDGAMRGVEYVLRQQCAQLREQIGFSEDEAARRVGVSVERLRALLEGLDWREAAGIPLATVQAAIKRLESREGYTLEEAAAALAPQGATLQWVKDRKRDGTIRVMRAKWDRRRVYITEPMLGRLREALVRPVVVTHKLSSQWLTASDAATDAGVSTTTVGKWAEDGEIERKHDGSWWRYHREAVRARARRYWAEVRFHRARPPAWLVETRMAA